MPNQTMILDWIKKVWNFVNRLDSQLKTVIIIILFICWGYPQIVKQNRDTLINYFEHVEKQNIADEGYTLKMAHYINEYIFNIQKSDPDCYNVILLNYHNSQKSLQGFRYLYLNCLTESPRGLDSEPLKQYWNDLEYVYYENELNKIRNNGYLRIENIDSIKTTFPKLYKKLLICDAKAAAFYPIEGIDSPIGMVIVLYKQPKKYSLGYYNSNVSPWIQKLSTILDYQNVKQKVK